MTDPPSPLAIEGEEVLANSKGDGFETDDFEPSEKAFVPPSGSMASENGNETNYGESLNTTTFDAKEVFKRVTIDDFEVKEVNGHVVSVKSVCSIPINSLRCRELRSVCSALKLRGLKNVSKAKYMEAIEEVVQNHYAHNTANPKTMHCPYRLLNVLFSVKFVNEFAQILVASLREEIESKYIGIEEEFWKNVQLAYVGGKIDDWDTNNNPNVFHKLQFDDAVFIERKIDPSIIVSHTWMDLRKIWNKIRTEHTAAQGRFQRWGDGNTSYDFVAACQGKLDVYYLHKFLETHPYLKGIVLADYSEAKGVNRILASANKKRKFIETVQESTSENYQNIVAMLGEMSRALGNVEARIKRFEDLQE